MIPAERGLRNVYVATFPAQVEDAKTAVRWLKAHAADYSIDPTRMVLAGDSSGGHTALMVHATQDLAQFDAEPGQPLGIGAVIDFYGPTDLAALTDDPSLEAFIQRRLPPET